MLLTISTLFYGKPDVSQKFLRHLEATLTNRRDVQVIIRNHSGIIDKGASEEAVFKCGLRNLVYIKSDNSGFGAGHNANLNIAKAPFFAILNNDLFLHDKEWIEKAIAPLKDPKIGLVGLEGSPCSFRPDGSGFVGKQREYVEGSFVVGRTDDFRQYGLFSEAFPMFFCEDSSLSLRFRQMGMDLAFANIKHEHIRSQSLNTVDSHYKDKIFTQNVQRFRTRWGNYLVTRQLTNRILVKMNSLGIGDVVSMTPVLEGIRKDHPKAHIEVTTPYPDVFVGNPYLTELYEIKREYRKAYDRVIDIKPVYSKYDPIVKQAEEIAITQLSSHAPQLFLTGLEAQEGQKAVNRLRDRDDQVVMGISLQMERTIWQGRNWPDHYVKDYVDALHEIGVKVIEFGKGTKSTGRADLDLTNALTLRQYFSIVANLDVFTTIDSVGLHVAQAFKVPTFCLFGATSPLARIVDWTSVFPIMSKMGCVGCYQRKGPTVPDTNVCEVGGTPCMEELGVDEVMKVVTLTPDELLRRNIEYLQKNMARA